MIESIAAWAGWLAAYGDSGKMEVLRMHADKGLPCGSEGFVKALGEKLGRTLQYRPQGRPAKGKVHEKG